MDSEKPGLTQDFTVSPPRTGTIASFESIERKPGRVEPAWVLSGQPMTNGGGHSVSEDGGSATAVWECTAGTFTWHYTWDETIYVIDGEVKLTSPDGKTTLVKAGDIVHFPAGTTWTWEVASHIRKVAFFHRPASKGEKVLRAVKGKLSAHSTAIEVGVGLAVSAAAALVALLALE